MKDKQPSEGSSMSGASKGGGKNRPCNQKKKKSAGTGQSSGKDYRTHATTVARKGTGQRIVVHHRRSR
jgi:hypothetical protein